MCHCTNLHARGLRRLEQTQKLCYKTCSAFLVQECPAPLGVSLVVFLSKRITTKQTRSDGSYKLCERSGVSTRERGANREQERKDQRTTTAVTLSCQPCVITDVNF